MWGSMCAPRGGIIVLPGSRSLTAEYKLIRCEGEPAPVPDWLVKYLTPQSRKRKEESAPSKSKAHKTEPTQAPPAPAGFPDSQTITEILAPHLYDICERLSSLIPARTLSVYNNWLHFLFALKNTLGEAGFAIFEKKSSEDEKYEGLEACRRKWDQQSADGEIGLDLLYAWARKTNTTEDFEKVMCATHSPRKN